MSSIAGELWVEVKPLTTTFGPTLEREIVGSSQEAGVLAGRSAGVGFSEGFRTSAGVGTAVKTELGQAERATTGAATGFSGLGKAVAYASGTFLAVGGLAEGIKASVSEAANLQGNLAIVERQIRNVGAANEVYGKSIESVIRANALQTGFSENDLVPAFGRLVSATHDSTKAYKDLGLAEDVARARHLGVAQAALALGKAEQGSVTSLQRLGIILPPYAKQLDATQKATAALAIVQARFGGTADAYATTSAGSLARLSVAANVLKETIGGALLPEIEGIATRFSDWISKSQNLAKVQNDVSSGAHLVADGFHAIGDGVKVAEQVLGPLVDTLGGVKNAAELVFGVIAVRKIVAYGLTVKASVSEYVTSLTGAAAANERYVASSGAVVAANEAQTASFRILAGSTSTATFATEGATAAETAETAAAGRRSFGVIGGELGTAGAGAGNAGLYGAALFGGYAIGTLAIDKLGLKKPLEDAGGALEKFAGSVGLASKAVDDSHAVTTRLARPTTQAALRADYQNVQKIQTTPFIQALGGTIDATERATLVQQARQAAFEALKTGFTYHDAAVFAGAFAASSGAAVQSAAFTHRGADLGVGQPGAPTAVAAQSTVDLDQAIALQKALQTKTTADELAIYQSRKAFLDKRISILESDATLTKAQKETLLAFEKEVGGYDSSIQTIQNQTLQAQKAAQQAAAAAKQKEQQAYQAALSLSEQKLQIAQQAASLTTSSGDDLRADRALEAFYRKEVDDAKLSASQRLTYRSALISIEGSILQTDQTAYQDQLSLREQRLQLAAQRAQLTQKNLEDDRKAARALIAFYTEESKDAKLTAAQRLQYASQAIQERLTLQGLKKSTTAATGATVGQIFGEAASEFGQYGSNISGRSGVLSGQDERARYSQLLLMEKADRPAATRHSQALTEAEKQTAYLARIASAIAPAGKAGTAGKPRAASIVKARRGAQIVGG